MSSEDPRVASNRQSNQGLGGDGLSERLARVEAKMEFVATREDIARMGQDLATLIASKEASMQRWLLGITSAALASVVIALLRTFA